MFRLPSIAFLVCLATSIGPVMAQAPSTAARPPRPVPPTRDPNTPGYVTAKDLPDGANAPAKADGNFILGPTHSPAPEMTAQEGVPQGEVFNFTMESTDSKIYPGIAREPGTFGTADPDRPRQTDCHYQPPRSVHAPGLRVRSQAICPRHRERPSSSGPTDLIAPCSPRWTI